MNSDTMRTIRHAEAIGGLHMKLEWSDGAATEIALPQRRSAAGVGLGDWGHSLTWPDGFELGADSLWLDTLDAIGRGDARQFLEWRLANGLSLSKAAEALGLARRTVAYYSNGDRSVPKTVLLACKGWDATHRRKAA
jgi:Helix-turn-helix